MVLMRQKKTDEALEYFQKAIILHPQYARAHYQLAILFKQKGQIEESNSHYQEAMRIKALN
jgi:Tfp pilus assembly protein PilF